MSGTETFRPRSGLIQAGAGVVLCVLFVWSTMYEGSARNKVVSALVALSIIGYLYAFLIRPKIIFSNSGMVIINPVSEYSIAWTEVSSVDNRWALTIHTDQFVAQSWAATVSGRPRRSIHESEVRGLELTDGESIRVADAPYSNSGAAIYRVRMYMKRHAESGIAEVHPTYARRNHLPWTVATGILVLAIVINFLH